MKNTFLILICVFVILGCKNQKRVDNELYKCLEEFNNVLQEVNFGANTNQSDYFFDTIFEIIPTFIPTFYTSDFLENFYFFKVKNDIGEMNLALEKKSEHNCHKLYFIEIENLSEDSIISYVDENEYLTGHFSFFENCGFKLETLNIIDSVNYKWYGNIFNMNDIGYWKLKESYMQDVSSFNYINISKNKITIDSSETFEYKKDGKLIINKTTNVVEFYLLASSRNSMLIKMLDEKVMLFKKEY